MMSLWRWFACCLSFAFVGPYKCAVSRDGASCPLFFADVLSFERFSQQSRQYPGDLLCTTRAHFFFFLCLCFFCVCRCRFRLEVTARCHLHALLVASCCLPDPLNAPLCWYVDMAPSAVGHYPLLRCRRGKTPEQHRRRLSQITILVKRNTAVGKKKRNTLTF